MVDFKCCISIISIIKVTTTTIKFSNRHWICLLTESCELKIKRKITNHWGLSSYIQKNVYQTGQRLNRRRSDGLEIGSYNW